MRLGAGKQNQHLLLPMQSCPSGCESMSTSSMPEMLNAEPKMRRGQPGHLTRRDLKLLHVWLAVYLRASFSRVLLLSGGGILWKKCPRSRLSFKQQYFHVLCPLPGPFIEEQACDRS